MAGKGARVVGESMVKGIEPRINVEHALHVLEIIEAARKSSATRHENKTAVNIQMANAVEFFLAGLRIDIQHCCVTLQRFFLC